MRKIYIYFILSQNLFFAKENILFGFIILTCFTIIL